MPEHESSIPLAQRLANANSILGVPFDQLPPGQAREDLLGWALNGQDVYAYAPVHRDDLEPGSVKWNVWVNGQRFTAEEWYRRY